MKELPALALFFVAVSTVLPASAQVPSPLVPSPNVSQPMIELEIQRNVQQQQLFEMQQRRNREDDRRMNMQPLPTIQVPRVSPGCQIGSQGNPSPC